MSWRTVLGKLTGAKAACLVKIEHAARCQNLQPRRRVLQIAARARGRDESVQCKCRGTGAEVSASPRLAFKVQPKL